MCATAGACINTRRDCFSCPGSQDLSGGSTVLGSHSPGRQAAHVEAGGVPGIFIRRETRIPASQQRTRRDERCSVTFVWVGGRVWHAS